jgi:hypothetical protein
LKKTELIKISENEYIPNGRFTAWKTIEKSKIIDGLKYINSHNEEYVFDCKEVYLKHPELWFKRSIDLSQFGIPKFYLWDYGGFCDSIYHILFPKYSENITTNIYILVFNMGLIDKSIISFLDKHKSNGAEGNGIDILLGKGLFEFVIMEFGWGNVLSVSLSIKSFLNLDFSKIDIPLKQQIKIKYMGGYMGSQPCVLPEYVLKYGLLTDNQKINIASDILKLKIKHKQKTENYERTS